MSSVLVLSSRPDNPILTPDVVARLLPEDRPVTVLAENWAVECPADGIDLARFDIQNMPIDVNVVTLENRRKKLLLADMDSTIITVECVDELADFVGVKDRVSQITERAMAGELDFYEALVARVALLEGLTTEQLQAAYDTRVHLTAGARTFVRTMAENGATCALVSGGFTFFTQRVKDAAGFHHHQSNELEIKDGCLTGRVVPPVLDAEAKLTALNTFTTDLDLSHQEALCIGDGSNDRFMVGAAGLGIAFQAQEILKSHADAVIHHGDLHTALVLQGYTADEFIKD